jgi:xylan 1,4-beta-xylosidase
MRLLAGFAGWLVFLLYAAAANVAHAETADDKPQRRFRTYANPVDLPYRYQSWRSPYREAADPTIVRFKDRYWLFASHSKGYWHSTDLLQWNFVKATGFDVDRYAPTVMIKNGRFYLTTSEKPKKIWSTDDPMSGQWSEAADIPGYDDPALFLDDDERVYLYEGLTGKGVLRALELDANTFMPLRETAISSSRDKDHRGWEVVGDSNEAYRRPSYIEGAWMTKHKGRYYLQYAAPGTEFKSYADGVLVADKPMGPFIYQPYSPFSVKPTGFVTGAGHGSTFHTVSGDWWHAGTMTISRRHMFERRIGLFPTSFTATGEVITDTYLGDYPRYIDGQRELTGWMLLSRRKRATASSSLDKFPVENATDEEIRTWWSAKTGSPDEWFHMDLGAPKKIQAVQINFADQDATATGISTDEYRYVLEVSRDARKWKTVVDTSNSGRDAPHDYRVLAKPERARFVRLRNVHTPDGAKFSLYDLRVFGNGTASSPRAVGAVRATRDRSDGRQASISWDPAPRAEFYIVRLGTRPDLLNQNFQVYDGATSLQVRSLNVGVEYFVAVDAVNENGVSSGATIPVL